MIRWSCPIQSVQLGSDRDDMITTTEVGPSDGKDMPMTPAKRELKNAGVLPLAFQSGCGGDTATSRHIPGYAEK